VSELYWKLKRHPFTLTIQYQTSLLLINLLQHAFSFSGPGFKVLGVMWQMISMGLSNILLHVFYNEFQSEDYPKPKTLMPHPLHRRGANEA
jgi:hypothetical protein